MSDKELKALLVALDSLVEAGFPIEKVIATAERIGVEWE